MKQILTVMVLVLALCNVNCLAIETSKQSEIDIIKAIRNGNVEEVNEYVKTGADLNQTRLSQSILLTAIKAQQPEILDILLQGGADPNIGITPPLFYSTWIKPDCEITVKLLKYGADLNKKMGGTTIQAYALVKAIDKQNNEMLDLLLENGADPNAKYSIPLLYDAVSKKNSYAVKKLLEAGADQNKTFAKTTAEQYAILCKNEEIMQIFNDFNKNSSNK